MKVIKFGGSSVGSKEGLLQIKKIVESQDEPVIVVVSALSQITDSLYEASKMAAAGNAEYLVRFEEMRSRHYKLANSVVPSERLDATINAINQEFNDLNNIFRGVYLIKDISSRITDTLVAYGEIISSIILSNVIENAKHYDSRDFIKTINEFKKHIVDFPTTDKLIQQTFSELNQTVVCGGFISSDLETGYTTNLGRGGSDYTASILASALDASKLEIWTDVDGFMTADPKIISNTYIIEQLSFSEAMELSNFGAKVIYPPTIFPVYHKNIPVLIKNTFNPEGPGTKITSDKPTELINKNKAIKGISSISDTTLITVQGLGMVGVIGVNHRIFRSLAENGISVFMVSQASSENNTSIGVRNADSKMAVKVLSAEFKVEIQQGEIDPIVAEDNLATIAIVGDNMKRTPGIAGKLFGTLGRNGINVIACAQGASETNISFVTDRDMLRKALNVIHDSFFLSEYKVLNLFVVGVGTVGGSLLEQIRSQRQKLMSQNGLKINVVGIASSKKMLLERHGIDLTNCQEKLKTEGIESTIHQFKDEVLKMNIYNPVFVDCTASNEVASLYQQLLDNNISVVTANKIAASSEYARYERLKDTARTRGVKFLFETNVGAGLPVINTINNLTNSGDHILKMEAVLSGTLNFIFNTLSEAVPMSKAIQMAQEMGYSEPDPRIDLSGEDVIRKLVILSREAGYIVDKEDVDKNLFIPNKYFEGSLDQFWESISELDADFESRRKELVKENKCWRFVATMNEGKCSVGLRAIDNTHPFFDLQGSTNILSIQTERYNEFPLIIKGYGAGASVTAAGVFSDIISVANVR